METKKDPFEGLFPRSIKKENATKFDYDAKTEKWSETKIKIQILDECFAEGSMRQEKFKIIFSIHREILDVCIPNSG